MLLGVFFLINYFFGCGVRKKRGGGGVNVNWGMGFLMPCCLLVVLTSGALMLCCWNQKVLSEDENGSRSNSSDLMLFSHLNLWGLFIL